MYPYVKTIQLQTKQNKNTTEKGMAGRRGEGTLPALTVAVATRGGEVACRRDVMLPIALADTEKAEQHLWDIIR